MLRKATTMALALFQTTTAIIRYSRYLRSLHLSSNILTYGLTLECRFFSFGLGGIRSAKKTDIHPHFDRSVKHTIGSVDKFKGGTKINARYC